MRVVSRAQWFVSVNMSPFNAKMRKRTLLLSVWIAAGGDLDGIIYIVFSVKDKEGANSLYDYQTVPWALSHRGYRTRKLPDTAKVQAQ